MDEFKKVCLNRGKGLRAFFNKHLRNHPVVSLVYFSAAVSDLFFLPLSFNRGAYLKGVRALCRTRGFFGKLGIFKIH